MRLLAKLRRELDKGWRKLRAPQGVRELPPEFPIDFADFTRRLYRRVGPHTMTSKERVAAIERAVRHVHAHGIAGDIVECGVAGGGSVMAFALTLMELGDTARTLWLYDTFAGMSEPTDEDVGRFGDKAMRAYQKKLEDGVSTWINVPLDQVKDAVGSTNYPKDRMEFVVGKVEDTLLQRRPESIAILRLDTDWYESTKVELEHLYPLVVSGGIILLDDYFRWQGHRKAVDEYVAANDLAIFWSRVDDHAVIGVKP